VVPDGTEEGICWETCGTKATDGGKGEPSDADDELELDEFSAGDGGAEEAEDTDKAAGEGDINVTAAVELVEVSAGASFDATVEGLDEVVTAGLTKFAADSLPGADNERSFDMEEVLGDGAVEDEDAEGAAVSEERLLLPLLLLLLAEEVAMEVRFLDGGNICVLKLLGAEPDDKPFVGGPPCPSAVDARKHSTAPHLQNIVDARGEGQNESRCPSTQRRELSHGY